MDMPDEIVGLFTLGLFIIGLLWFDKKIKNHADNYTSNQEEAKKMIESSALNSLTLNFVRQVPSNNRGFNGMCFLYNVNQDNHFLEVVYSVTSLEQAKKLEEATKGIIISSPQFKSENVTIREYLVNGKIVCNANVFGHIDVILN